MTKNRKHEIKTTPPNHERNQKKQIKKNTLTNDDQIITVIQHSLRGGISSPIFTISQTNPTTSKYHGQQPQTHQVFDGVPYHLAYAELSKQQAHHSKFSNLQGRGNTDPSPRVSNSDTSIQA